MLSSLVGRHEHLSGGARRCGWSREVSEVGGEGGARACPREAGASWNDMRAMGTERCHG
jgi:hypothetical protein